MAIDTSTLEATLQTKFDNVTDPKEMLLLGKAYEATVGGIAVSDIEDAGAAQVATINSVATNTFKTVGGTSILGTGDVLPSQTGNADLVLKTDGSTLSWGQGGGVLQVKHIRDDSNGTLSINNSGAYWSGLDVTITPMSDSSLLVFEYHISAEASDHEWIPQIWTNGSAVSTSGYEGYSSTAGNTYYSGLAQVTYDGDQNSTPKTTSFGWAHPSQNTSARTYNLRIVSSASGVTQTLRKNRAYGSAGSIYEYLTSSVTVWEVVQ
jgi:hypothetical protein